MYEILNIMKSVGLVSRVKTCAYRWEGFDIMVKHLKELKVSLVIRFAMDMANSTKQTRGPPTKTHAEICKTDDNDGSKNSKGRC